MKRPLLYVTIVTETKPLCILEMFCAFHVPTKAAVIHPVQDKAHPRKTKNVYVDTKGADTLVPINDPR